MINKYSLTNLCICYIFVALTTWNCWRTNTPNTYFYCTYRICPFQGDFEEAARLYLLTVKGNQIVPDDPNSARPSGSVQLGQLSRIKGSAKFQWKCNRVIRLRTCSLILSIEIVVFVPWKCGSFFLRAVWKHSTNAGCWERCAFS